MPAELHMVYLILGGNMGEPIRTFKNCMNEFESRNYQLMDESAVYKSEAWGYESNFPFYNQVIVLKTNHNPHEILSHILEIEAALGRVKRNIDQYEDRTIDIDILFFDDVLIAEDSLTIPHPRLHLRKFCLIPLANLNPDLWHPGLNKTIWQLLQECPDQSLVIQL